MDIRFTQSKDGKTLFALVLEIPKDSKVTIQSLAAHSPHWSDKIGSVELVGGGKLEFTRDETGVHVALPGEFAGKTAWVFDPLPCKVLSARVLGGDPVKFVQSDKELSVQVSERQYDAPVTVIELTLDQPVKDGTTVGSVRGEDLSEHGKILSENATLEISSQSRHDQNDHDRLFKGDKPKHGKAFQTEPEKNPWAKIDLGAVRNVKAVVIENQPLERRTDGLILSVSADGKKWEEVWKAEQWDLSWTIPVTTFEAGAEVPGRKARYFKVETKGDSARPLILQRFTVYGE